MSLQLRHLPWLLAVSSATLVAATAAGGLVRGVDGALGAAAGVALAIASYTFSTLVIAWADSVKPGLVLPFGMAAYIVKFSLIAAVVLLVAASGWPGLAPMGLGLVAGTLAWTITQAWWTVRNAPSALSVPPPPLGSAASDDARGGNDS